MSENQNELRLSVSKTKCFTNCPKQFEFSYILKFPKKERDYHIAGTFCHAVLEYFHNQYIAGSTLSYNLVMADAFKNAWNEHKAKMTPVMKKECWELINNYLKSISGKNMNVLAMEKRFTLPIGENVLLNGAIDMLFLDNNGMLNVADFKTSKSKKYLEKDFYQLETYCYVLFMEDPSLTKIKASYIMLRHNSEYIPEIFTRDKTMDIKDKYLDIAEKIRNEKDFAATPNQLCSFCDFLEWCPSGKEKAGQNPMNNAKIFGEVNW